MPGIPIRIVLVAAVLIAVSAVPSVAQVQWTTLVNGQPWVEGMEIDVEMGDTVEIVDTFTNNTGATVGVDLDQSFVASEVLYITHTVTGGTVTQPAGQVLWAVTLGAGQSATLTVWFFAAQCNWPDSPIDRLWVAENLRRDVILDKWLHDLQIGSSYEPLVFAAQPATFQLQAGNDGGYENSVEIGCSFSPDAPFGSSSPQADSVGPSGLTAAWILGDFSNGSFTSINVTVEVAAGLPPGTPVPSSCSIYDHTGTAVATTSIDQITATTTQWETFVNTEPWFPGIITTHETGDTIEIVEELYNRSGAQTSALLQQGFEPSELSLLDVTVSDGTVSQDPGQNEWTVQIAVGHAVTMTSLFFVEPCTWTESAINTILAESSELRTTSVEKTPPALWIESTYDSLVVPGQPALIALGYGNGGGYENNATLWCALPPEAPFGGSVPPADFVDPTGVMARWNLGDLATDTSGMIDLTAEIEVGLPPGVPIEISCSIYDHVDGEAGTAVISLETVDAFAIFADDFETGNMGAWSSATP